VYANARVRTNRAWSGERPADGLTAGDAPVTRPRSGAAGFDEFYGASAARVVRHAYALTGNMADAQEVAQEAFARAWQHWSSVSGYESPEAWVRRVATNLAASRWRRRRTASAADLALAKREAVDEVSPDTVALVAGLRTLPERQRTVLVLHYLADLPVAQVAAELGCPVGSVKVWLARGRAALAEAIGGQDTDRPPDRCVPAAEPGQEVAGA
jgi:RNA polymerase sigma-70 factor, ECF subfamily